MVPACTVKLTATANLLVPDTPYGCQYQNYGIPGFDVRYLQYLYTPRDVQNTKRLILEYSQIDPWVRATAKKKARKKSVDPSVRTL